MMKRVASVGMPVEHSNMRSMPSRKDESPLLAELKARIAILSNAERAMLRPWILAKYDVQGYALRPVSQPSSRD